jgi:hypothetical protein
MEQTKYFIFLDNSGSMSSYYKNIKSQLEELSDLDLTNNNLTFLTFESKTNELAGSTFKDKLVNYKPPGGMTELKGVATRFHDYVICAPVGQKICILFVTDGDVSDLYKITPILVDCVDAIASNKLSVYMSCVAINSSADMKAFSLLGLLNNFSVFQLIQTKNGDGWGAQVFEKFKEVRDCETCIYETESTYIYSGITCDSRISEKGALNKVFLATLVQAFTICNFTPNAEKGFSLCKRLLKYVVDLGVNAKTRYIWSKLNTAKMVGDQDSIAIANEFMSTIADAAKVTTNNSFSEEEDTTHNNVSTTNEHNARIRFFVGSTKSFTNCLPIATHNNQVVIQSGSSNELYLNIEVYHPTEPVYVEVAYADSKHTWFVPYGVSLIEGDTNFLMLAHEKLDANNANKEKMFDFMIKVVPASLTSPISECFRTPAPVLRPVPEYRLETASINVAASIDVATSIDIADSIIDVLRSHTDHSFASRQIDRPTSFCDDLWGRPTSFCDTRDDSWGRRSTLKYALCDTRDDSGRRSSRGAARRCSKAFPTVSQETRKIDTVKRTHRINSNAHVLCFTFSFVYESDPDSWKAMLIKIPLLEVVFITKKCIICVENESTIKLLCNHKCMCYTCHSHYIKQSKNCPMCRALISI